MFRGRLFAIKGSAASSYWNLVSYLLMNKTGFERSVREGATDMVNVLLNYGYGILYTRIWGAAQYEGLNPFISFLHAFQKGKPTLVYDLIEEFRAPVVDRVIIALISKNEITPWQDSEVLPQPVRKKLAEEILHRLYVPDHYCGKSKKMSDIILKQVHDVRLFLEGKKRSYQPFICKW